MAETSGAAVRTVLDTGAGLVRRLVTVPDGSWFEGTAGPGGELWFVIAGAGRLTPGDAPPAPVRPHTGGWLPPGRRSGRAPPGQRLPARRPRWHRRSRRAPAVQAG